MAYCYIGNFFVLLGVFLVDVGEDGEDGRHVFSADDAVYVVLRDAHDEGRQAQHADQVGHGHQTVKGVRKIPGKTEVHGRAHVDDENKYNLVGDGRPRTKQILPCFGIVVAPSKHRREGKQQD